MLCKLYSNANIPIFAGTLGSFFISFKLPFCGYHSIWLHLVSFFWIILRGWLFNVCAPYTLIQIEYFVHKPWGASSYYLEHPFGLILISLLSLFFGSFDCSLHSLKVSSPCYLILFAIFDPQYSLVPSEYFPLDIYMCFTHFFNAHQCGGTPTILVF
jgi:hypothetical protein